MKAASHSETARANRPYRQKTFAALKLPAYRVFFGALFMQMTAMNMQMVARSWFMYELTGSAVMLGAVKGPSLLLTLSIKASELAISKACSSKPSADYADNSGYIRLIG